MKKFILLFFTIIFIFGFVKESQAVYDAENYQNYISEDCYSFVNDVLSKEGRETLPKFNGYFSFHIYNPVGYFRNTETIKATSNDISHVFQNAKIGDIVTIYYDSELCGIIGGFYSRGVKILSSRYHTISSPIRSYEALAQLINDAQTRLGNIYVYHYGEPNPIDSNDIPLPADSIPINEINFPDEAFRNIVSSKFDKNYDDVLSAEEMEEIKNITKLEIDRQNIYNLKGIEHFTGLQILSCSRNKLTELDVTNLPNLQELTCSLNELTKLDISNLSALQKLDCTENPLTDLNISSCPNLWMLDISYTPVTNLNFSGHKSLCQLRCEFCKQLKTLDVSYCTNLFDIFCFNTQLKILNARGCSSLWKLYCKLTHNTTEFNLTECPLLDKNFVHDEDIIIIRYTGPKITTETLGFATINKPYSHFLNAQGTEPIKWSKVGSLPKGLELSEWGTLYGTPEKAKNYNIKVKATNDYGTDTKSLTLPVYEIPSITTETLKEKIFGKKYSTSLKAKGTKPITWRASGLPLGLNIDKDNGKISGLPLTHGIVNVKITAENLAGYASKDFVLKINGIPPKFSGKLAKGNLYESYLSAFTIKKGTYPITWALEGNLPDGLTFSDGVLSGTPTQIFNDYVTMKLSNDAGEFVKQMKLTIKGKKPKITTRNLEAATVGEVYTVNFEAEGSPVITWSAENLPENFSLNGNTLTGTPTEKGKIKFVIIAANPVKSVRKNFKINVKEADKSLLSEVQSNAEEKTKENSILLGVERGVNSLSKKHLQKLEGCEIAAVLPQISVDVSGLYDLEVELNENVETGKKLIYFAFPKNSVPSEDDEIIEFYNEDGEEISTVPENHKIIISAWFNEKIIYEPVIAVKEN